MSRSLGGVQAFSAISSRSAPISVLPQEREKNEAPVHQAREDRLSNQFAMLERAP